MVPNLALARSESLDRSIVDVVIVFVVVDF